MYSLRELAREDIKTINSWRNKKELIDNLGAPYRFITFDVDNIWYDNYLSSRNNTIRCAVVDKENKILGLVSLTNIDRINQSAVLHIMIGDEEHRGKGLGTFAVSEIIEHAFYNMNLRRIELSVLKDNIRAQALYKKVGFRTEGEKQEAIFKNGKFVNLYSMALLKSEYNFKR